MFDESRSKLFAPLRRCLTTAGQRAIVVPEPVHILVPLPVKIIIDRPVLFARCRVMTSRFHQHRVVRDPVCACLSRHLVDAVRLDRTRGLVWATVGQQRVQRVVDQEEWFPRLDVVQLGDDLMVSSIDFVGTHTTEALGVSQSSNGKGSSSLESTSG